MTKTIEITWTEVVTQTARFSVPDDFDPRRGPVDGAYGDGTHAALCELVCEDGADSVAYDVAEREIEAWRWADAPEAPWISGWAEEW